MTRLLFAFLVLLGTAVPGRAHHPHDVVDAFALNPSFPWDGTVFVSNFDTNVIKVFERSTDHGRSWTVTGAGIPGGAVTGVAVAGNWKTTGVVYAVTTYSGLHRSDDRGRTWYPITAPRDLRYLAYPQTLGPVQVIYYAGTDSLYRMGPGGTERALWGVSGLGERITALAASPSFASDTTLAFATSEPRIYVSRDGGESFVDAPVPASVNGLRISPAFRSDGTIWAATEGMGIWRSTDGGATFGQIGTDLPDWRVNDAVPVPTYPNPPELWATTADSGVYISTDDGVSWTRSSLRVLKTYQSNSHYRKITFSPRYPQPPIVYCGTFEGLFLSTDAGASWNQANINPSRIGVVIDISPNFAADRQVMAVGYGMTFQISEDGGDNWDVRMTDFNSPTGMALSVSPDYANDSLFFVGVQHGLRRSTDGGRHWQHIWFSSRDSLPANKVQSVAFSPEFATDGLVYAVGVHGLYRSTDRGLSWSESLPVRPLQTVLAFSPDFANDSTFFVGGKGPYGLLRTRDGGRTYDPPLLPPGVSATEIAISPDFAVSGEIYCLSGEMGVVRSTDWGDTWELVNDGLGGAFPYRLRMARDFDRNRTLVVSTTGNGLFRSSEPGAPRWVPITDVTSPVETANDFVLSPGYPADSTIFVANASGIWRTTDGGASWVLTTQVEVYDDDREDPWIFEGDWAKEVVSGSVNYSVRASATAGDRASISFFGRRIRVLGTAGPDHGIARFTMDGRPAGSFDAYQPDRAVQVPLADFAAAEVGYHTLVVEVTGDGNPASTGRVVTVDAAEVTYR